jgi:type II secretory ATPase GspE/PulE/Tfp pilus assembly ATPase PilB-like protein
MGPSCHGLGYLGRTGIFELLTVDDTMRDALLNQPKLEVLRQIAKKSGHRGLQEEGVLLVAQGITSLTELQRVLKQ